MQGTSLYQSWAPKSILIQLFRREDLTFPFRLTVCHLRYSLRLIYSNFDRMHQESVTKRENRVLGWNRRKWKLRRNLKKFNQSEEWCERCIGICAHILARKSTSLGRSILHLEVAKFVESVWIERYISSG